MAVFKPRTKLISFRLSEEEYEKLHVACVAEGARSISEFARMALQRSFAGDGNLTASEPPTRTGPGARELIDVMQELNHHLRQLVALVGNKQTRSWRGALRSSTAAKQ